MNAPRTALHGQDTTITGSLYVAFELGDRSWKLSLGDGVRAPSCCTVAAGDTAAVFTAIAKAKVRCHLAADAPVRSCYEAGRDGFWLHRCLEAHWITNLVVDSASIEVNRRRRRAKTDRLDSDKLLSMLMRYYGGERRVWAVARIPTPEQEDERRVHRELNRLRQERTAHTNRIRSLLVLHNLRVERIGGRAWAHWWAQHAAQLLPALRAEIEREFERLSLAARQIRTLEAQQQSMRFATGRNPRSRGSRALQASERAVPGPWSGNCLAGGSFTTAAKSPAAWAWRRHPMPAVPVKLSRASARSATSGPDG